MPKIIIDPRDRNRLFVAVLGHPLRSNTERSVYRSTDDGATFESVLTSTRTAARSDLALDGVRDRHRHAAARNLAERFGERAPKAQSAPPNCSGRVRPRTAWSRNSLTSCAGKASACSNSWK